MGDFSASSSQWKKMVLSKSNSNEWTSNVKSDMSEGTNVSDISSCSELYKPYSSIKTEGNVNNDSYEKIQNRMNPEIIMKKMVSSKSNSKEWNANIKSEVSEGTTASNSFSIDYNPYSNSKSKTGEESYDSIQSIVEPEITMVQDDDPLFVEHQRRRHRGALPKEETMEERASRLAKMSAYAAQRLANESPEQRATRLKRMSEYAAKRLAQETSEQRARRLSRMSAYAARRLAKETPEQRQIRLTRMSEYAARRQAMKKFSRMASSQASFDATQNSNSNSDPLDSSDQS